MKATRWTKEMINEYTRRGFWTSVTWPDIYDRNASLYPDKEAIVGYRNGERKSTTWETIKNLTDRLAGGFLKFDFKKDDRVLCQLPNGIENVAIKIAFEKAGLIFAHSAINTWELENEEFLKGLEASAVVSLPEYHDRNHYNLFRDLHHSGRYPYFKYLFLIGLPEEIPSDAISIEKMLQNQMEDNDPAPSFRRTQVDAFEVSHIATTSGTTGLPKLIELSANSLRLIGRCVIERWNIRSNDIGFTTAFLWTGPSHPVILAVPQVGGTIILMDSFEPAEAIKIIEQEKPTYFAGLPSQIIDMANHPEFDRRKVSSLRFLSFGGAPFPSGLAKKCEEKFERPLLNLYGAMDALMIFCSGPNDPPEVRWGSPGKASSWDEFKIVNPETGEQVPPGEEGILYWRGPTASGGYYRDPKRTKEVWGTLGIQGWYHTGDVARADKEGRIWIVGRAKEMILRGGQNIFPLEIEELLGTHPHIINVSIVPMPDTRLGEKACAYIIPKKGKVFTFEDMKVYLEKKGLAKYKFPERLELVNDFPKVGDKVDKRSLASDICNKLFKEGKISKELVENFIRTGKVRPEQVEL
jgi:non-ribosomal peptide synthetase component E (peptide arylation enzyme)